MCFKTRRASTRDYTVVSSWIKCYYSKWLKITQDSCVNICNTVYRRQRHLLIKLEIPQYQSRNFCKHAVVSGFLIMVIIMVVWNSRPLKVNISYFLFSLFFFVLQHHFIMLWLLYLKFIVSTVRISSTVSLQKARFLVKIFTKYNDFIWVPYFLI